MFRKRNKSRPVLPKGGNIRPRLRRFLAVAKLVTPDYDTAMAMLVSAMAKCDLVGVRERNRCLRFENWLASQKLLRLRKIYRKMFMSSPFYSPSHVKWTKFRLIHECWLLYLGMYPPMISRESRRMFRSLVFAALVSKRKDARAALTEHMEIRPWCFGITRRVIHTLSKKEQWILLLQSGYWMDVTQFFRITRANRTKLLVSLRHRERRKWRHSLTQLVFDFIDLPYPDLRKVARKELGVDITKYQWYKARERARLAVKKLAKRQTIRRVS